MYKVASIILFILTYSTIYSVESKKLIVKETDKIGFSEIGINVSNINFKNDINLTSAAKNQVILNGSGVTAGDYDKDGLIDLYFAGLEKSNKLYKNLGDFRFSDTTQKHIALNKYISTSAVFADINGDTWLDLLVGTMNSGIIIFQNKQGKTFERVKHNINTDINKSIYGIALTDLEHDGDLDIYISTYRNYSVRNNNNITFETKFINGKQTIDYGIDIKTNKKIKGDRFYLSRNGKIFEMGVSDYLLINNNGIFEYKQIFSNSNEENDFYRKGKNWGLGCIFADLNGDYHDDLYVCNDLDGSDYLFLYNNKTKKLDIKNQIINYSSPMFSMGVDVADINNDTLVDIFVVDMLNRNFNSRKEQLKHLPEYTNIDEISGYENNRNMLFQANTVNSYDEISQYSGVDSSDWSWTPLFIDVNLDGLQDLLITNGFGYDLENINLNKTQDESKNGNITYFDNRIFDKKYVKSDNNYAFMNIGNSKFVNNSTQWNFNKKGISHGACLADLDNDGDEDVIVNNFGLYIQKGEVLGTSLPEVKICDSNASIYNNICSKTRIRVKVRLSRGNTYGIGSVIKFTQDNKTQTKQIRSGARYCSSDEYSVTFSYDQNCKTNILEVNLGSKQSKYFNVNPNNIYTFKDNDFYEKNSIFELIEHEKAKRIFGNHNPNKINTEIFQKNIGKKVYLSEPIINSINSKILYSKNNKLATSDREYAYQIDDNKFTLKDSFTLKYQNKDYLFVLSENIDYLNENQNSKLICYQNNGIIYEKINEILLKKGFNCFSWIYKNDDSIELILGGNFILGKYPKGYGSEFIEYNFTDMCFKKLINNNIFKNAAVNDIRVSDINRDGNYEVIFANEADKINIYTYKKDKFILNNKLFNIPELIGNWKSVAITDYNSDGDIDIIISNEGSNTQYTKYEKVNLFLSNSNSYLYRGVNINNKVRPLEHLDFYSNINPILKILYKNNDEFEENFHKIIKDSYNVKYDTQSTVLLVNNGNKFKIKELPSQVNFYSNIGMLSIDYDLNGYLDIIFTRNSFENTEENEIKSNIPLLILYQDESGYSAGEINIGNNNSRTISYYDYNDDFVPDLCLGNYNGNYYSFNSESKSKTIKFSFIKDDLQMFGTSIRLIYSNGKKGAVHEITNRRNFRSECERSIIIPSDNVDKVEIQNKNGRQYIKITDSKHYQI